MMSFWYRRNLELLLTRYCPEVEVAAIAHSADEAEKVIRDLDPDLIFLDVEMPHGNGFDLLKRFNQVRFGVIFVHRFDHYAIKAIKYSAIDYLLKPIDIDELVAAVQKAGAQLKSKSVNQSLNILLHNMAQPAAKLQKLSLPTTDGMIFVSINDILYCKSEGNYTSFYLENGQSPLITRQIGIYERTTSRAIVLQDTPPIYRECNRVTKYVKGRGGHVVMSDGK